MTSDFMFANQLDDATLSTLEEGIHLPPLYRFLVPRGNGDGGALERAMLRLAREKTGRRDARAAHGRLSLGVVDFSIPACYVGVKEDRSTLAEGCGMEWAAAREVPELRR
jgi:hypothetical protein